MLHKNINIYLCLLFSISSIFCQTDNTTKAPSLLDIENAVKHIVDNVKSCVVSIESCNSDDNFSKHSGVVLDNAGHIVTIASSIKNTKEICVTTLSGKLFPAQLVGIDDVTNLALIKVENAQHFSCVVKGDSSKLSLGSFLISVGNPYGLQNSPSLGIVSGLERVVKFDDSLLLGLIQTTAAINPGDAGGLAVDSKGQFVGVICSTLGTSQSMGNAMVLPQGINFVIPSNTVYWVCDNLIKHNEVKRGQVGVNVKDEPQGGVVITNVMKNSPAEKVGLEIGDSLQEVNGSSIKNARQLVSFVYHSLAGDVIEFKVTKKDKQVVTVKITLQSF
ncbi:S1C family serine protease [Candidatus Uabimicrobium sp. HlEnr_7]|uniref:S1C family serine protease n=1 Tax=Candidatus Uabimicrobium helgolandensis TaxID=3095367 RepID=UPI003557275A